MQPSQPYFSQPNRRLAAGWKCAGRRQDRFQIECGREEIDRKGESAYRNSDGRRIMPSRPLEIIQAF